MQCDRCGVVDSSVVKSKVFPSDFTPPPGRKCRCAFLCRSCRTLAVEERQ